MSGFRTRALAIKNKMGPKASMVAYQKAFDCFKEWLTDCEEYSQGEPVSEDMLLCYFEHRLQKGAAPSTLWPLYSKLKHMIKRDGGVDITPFSSLRKFIEEAEKGYVPKKAKVFSESELLTFLNEAPNAKFLNQKVSTILGVCGAMRVSEIYKLQVGDVVFDHVKKEVNVAVRETKTLKDRQFKVVNTDVVAGYDLRMYSDIVNKSTKRDGFLMTLRGLSVVNTRLGINRLTEHTKEVARFLGLSEPEKYTSHSSRRTATTILANKGASNVQMKTLGGWKNMTTVNGYIAENETMRRDTATKILELHSSRGAVNCTSVRPGQVASTNSATSPGGEGTSGSHVQLADREVEAVGDGTALGGPINED